MRRLVLQPFLIALQFLTILPVKIKGQADARAQAHSLLYYPVVGLVIGVLLVLLGRLLGDGPPHLMAALLLTAWALITGALHLDGLADSADAWVGGLGNRDKTLVIMKDVHCGAAAVVAVVLVLLIKFAALAQLVSNESWMILALAPVLGRTAALLLFVTTPYVRAGGLGSVFVTGMPQRASAVVTVTTLIVVAVLMGNTATWILVGFVAIFWGLRGLMLRRVGGTTGDTAGALIEVIEAGVLVAAAL